MATNIITKVDHVFVKPETTTCTTQCNNINVTASPNDNNIVDMNTLLFNNTNNNTFNNNYCYDSLESRYQNIGAYSNETSSLGSYPSILFSDAVENINNNSSDNSRTVHSNDNGIIETINTVDAFYSSESSMSEQAQKLQEESIPEPQPEEYFPEQEELDGYILIKQIGEGAFAKVFKAIPTKSGSRSFLLKNYKEVAIKVAMKNKLELGGSVESIQEDILNYKDENDSNNNDSHHNHRRHNHHHHHHRHHRHNHKRHQDDHNIGKNGKKLKTTTKDEMMAEVAIHRTVSNISPHIVNFIDFQESQSYYYVILERVTGGELFDQVIKYTYFSEDLTRHIIHQLAFAVKHLHSVGVVHRDIKLENILFEPIELVPSEDGQTFRDSDDKKTKLDEGKFIKGKGGAGIGIVKLTDFGLSKQIFHNNTTTPCGTLGYTAPEVISQNDYSMKVDIWGLGCVLYTLLCGFPPFYDENNDSLRKNICEGNYKFLEPWWNDISQGAKDLISKMLEIDPRKRYDIDDLLDDPWLTNYDCDSFDITDSSLNLQRIYSPPNAVKFHGREALIHFAFNESNHIQRTRERNEDFIMGTGFITKLGTAVHEENTVPRYNNFKLNLNQSTIARRRQRQNNLRNHFEPIPETKPNEAYFKNNTAYTF